MAHSGKTITFATDLLPNEDNTYLLGNSDNKWKIYASEINAPLIQKANFNIPVTASGVAKSNLILNGTGQGNDSTTISANGQVIQIVVTSGFSDLCEPIEWSVSENNNIILSAKTTNSVEGYILYTK